MTGNRLSRARSGWARVCLAGYLLVGLAGRGQAVPPEEVARQVDALLTSELSAGSATAQGGRSSDELFLRRLALDLVGELPLPEELTSFVLDPSPDKRAQAVERYLGDRRMGLHWGRYWRDVILSRRTDERALISAVGVTEYLAETFNAGAQWDEVARAFLTARGNLAESGETALIAAQWGEAADLAAEASRIFLGIQIQCAQCHDHPTDRWKRVQFHELAAFFPRVEIRPLRAEGKRLGFEVISFDQPPRRPMRRDKKVEHYMPDLDDPQAPGTLMQPVLFVTGQKLETGTTDLERRGLLADGLASRKNHWFSRAYVNRIWSELTGRGFYEPVDDLGPDRTCLAPKTLQRLSDEFERNRFDVKWLFRTIALTEAYQRTTPLGLTVAKPGQESSNLSDCCHQRLRSDQVYNRLARLLELPDGPLGQDRKGKLNPRVLERTPRLLFYSVFGYDPSTPADELAGSIPQALLLMNAPQLARSMRATGDTPLARMLAENPNDADAVTELYLQCLGREPRPAEREACLTHLGQAHTRAEAFEDLLWALVNSTEFLYRN